MGDLHWRLAVLVGRDGRLAGVLLLLLMASRVAALSYFTAFDANAMQRFVGRFGVEAKPHLLYWRDQVEARRRIAMTDQQRLEFVNRLSNQVPFEVDQSHWGMNEYWATPAEFVASNGGDCDDYAISKFFALIELGMAPEKLRMTYVRSLHAQGITHHMVLAYYALPDAEPLVLDNLVDEILPAGRRPDLLPVLSFNNDGAWNGRNEQKKTGSGEIRQWSELRQRMQIEAKP